VRLISSRNIRDGVELARDVVAGPPGTAPLLRAGVVLSGRYTDLLQRSGIGSIWIEDELGADLVIAEPLTPETRGKVHRATGTALREASAALRSGSGLPPSVVDSLSGVAEAMVGDLLDVPDAALVLEDLNSFDSYTHRHSVQVTVLGLLIARRMWLQDGWTDFRGQRRRDRLEQRLRKLGVGLLIHDVGKLAVPPELLDHAGEISDEDRSVLRSHAVAGADLLAEEAGLTHLAESVRHVHEAWDGSGYPDGLTRTAIPRLARLVAVVDAYDAMVDDRSHRPALSAEEARMRLATGAGRQFDPVMVSAYLRELHDERERRFLSDPVGSPAPRPGR